MAQSNKVGCGCFAIYLLMQRSSKSFVLGHQLNDFESVATLTDQSTLYQSSHAEFRLSTIVRSLEAYGICLRSAVSYLGRWSAKGAERNVHTRALSSVRTFSVTSRGLRYMASSSKNQLMRNKLVRSALVLSNGREKPVRDRPIAGARILRALFVPAP